MLQHAAISIHALLSWRAAYDNLHVYIAFTQLQTLVSLQVKLGKEAEANSRENGGH